HSRGRISMVRSALLLCAGILAALGLSCVPAAAPPQPIIAAGLCVPGNPDSFANAVQMAKSFPLVTTTTPQPDGPVPRNMWTDLRAAFAMAPPFFQQRLCNLSGVYVSEDGNSWGFRNSNPTDGGRYVAVTKDLWNGNAPAIPYWRWESQT